jgi:hypothetical protein
MTQKTPFTILHSHRRENLKSYKKYITSGEYLLQVSTYVDRIFVQVVTVPGCRPGVPGFDSRRYQIF